jgi:three-Cys-motif partner protein
MLAADGLLARSVGLWSKDKLRVVGNYMGIFTSSMKGKWDGLTYVDLFAGPGLCVVEDTGGELPGSPLLALDTKKPFDTVICVEQDDEARDALERRVRRHTRGNTVQVLAGDCNAIIGNVVTRMPRGFLSLVFIDPEGVSGLDADTMRALADQRMSVDLIVLFPQGMSVNRNRWQWIGSAEDTPLDRVLDGREWRTNTTPEVVQFMVLLRELGFTFVESARRAFKNRRGAQLYYLVFASKSPTAVNFWEKISRDEDQPSLFA